MARKFIVTGDTFLMGNVDYHSDLLPKGDKCMGGGYWHYDVSKKELYLWGASSDFGIADPEKVKEFIVNAWLSPTLSDFTVMHSNIISPTIPDLNTFKELTKLHSFSHE